MSTGVKGVRNLFLTRGGPCGSLTAMIRIRHLPAHVVKVRLRRAGYRQDDVAARSGVSRSVVSETIRHRVRTSPSAERVWRTIEIMVGESQEDTA